MPPRPSDRSGPALPPARAPTGYLLFGQLCLLLALGSLVATPKLLLRPLLDPGLVALVHLMTLGFVTATILGSLYLVGPFALRARLREGPGDVLALGLFAAGTAGMVWGFRSQDFQRVGLWGLPLLAASTWVAVRSLASLARSRLSGGFKIPFALAWTGFAVATVQGLIQALDRSGRILGGGLLDRVVAHAHLGLVGWATLMVLAAGNRLIPMVLPAAMPRGIRVWGPGSAVLVGILLFAAGRVTGARSPEIGGAFLALAGVVSFLATVVWMLRHAKSPGRRVPRPDLPRVSALSALLALAASAGMGISLVLGLSTTPTLPVAYGALALTGFLGQLIVGMEQRLVPWLVWMLSYSAHDHERAPPDPYRLPLRGLQALVTALWAVGPWALAVGALLSDPRLIRASALLLMVGIGGHLAVLMRYRATAFD